MIEYLLFGNTCSGKSTIGQILKREYNYSLISARDIINKNVSSADNSIKEALNNGFLIPDDIINHWIFEYLNPLLEKETPIVLDGFPRTENQAKALIERTGVKKIVNLEFDFNTLEKRMYNRVFCNHCEMPYSKIFSDFSYTCHYCNQHGFSQRPTDLHAHFKQRTSQFESLSLKVLPVFQYSNPEWINLKNYTTFGAIRETVNLFRDITKR